MEFRWILWATLINSCPTATSKCEYRTICLLSKKEFRWATFRHESQSCWDNVGMHRVVAAGTDARSGKVAEKAQIGHKPKGGKKPPARSRLRVEIDAEDRSRQTLQTKPVHDWRTNGRAAGRFRIQRTHGLSMLASSWKRKFISRMQKGRAEWPALKADSQRKCYASWNP